MNNNYYHCTAAELLRTLHKHYKYTDHSFCIKAITFSCVKSLLILNEKLKKIIIEYDHTLDYIIRNLMKEVKLCITCLVHILCAIIATFYVRLLCTYK